MKLKFFTFPACLSRQKHINSFKSTKQHRQPFASFYCHRGVTHLLHSPTGWLCCLLYVGGWKKDFPIFSYFWELRGAVCISYASKAGERAKPKTVHFLLSLQNMKSLKCPEIHELIKLKRWLVPFFLLHLKTIKCGVPPGKCCTAWWSLKSAATELSHFNPPVGFDCQVCCIWLGLTRKNCLLMFYGSTASRFKSGRIQK